MLITSWYYDERSQEFKKTSLRELKRLEYDNKEEFLYIKERLYRSQNKSVPMILVRKGLNQGFRRKGNSTGNHTRACLKIKKCTKYLFIALLSW